MDTDEAIEALGRLAAAPDALETVTAAVGKAGKWRTWPLPRQVWYLRKRHDLSQAELARRSGVSQRRICRIEAGDDLKLSTLKALWAAMGYEPLVIPARPMSPATSSPSPTR